MPEGHRPNYTGPSSGPEGFHGNETQPSGRLRPLEKPTEPWARKLVNSDRYDRPGPTGLVRLEDQLRHQRDHNSKKDEIIKNKEGFLRKEETRTKYLEHTIEELQIEVESERRESQSQIKQLEAQAAQCNIEEEERNQLITRLRAELESEKQCIEGVNAQIASSRHFINTSKGHLEYTESTLGHLDELLDFESAKQARNEAADTRCRLIATLDDSTRDESPPVGDIPRSVSRSAAKRKHDPDTGPLKRQRHN